MASEVKKRNPAKTDSLGNEIIAIIFLALAVLVFLCLISQSPNDPSIITASSQKTQNWIGVLGANIAAVLISFVGWTAYFLPALLALIAWRFFRAESLTFSFSRFTGYVLLVVSGASLLTLFGFYGGITGAFFEQIFSRFLGTIGTGVLLFAFLSTAFLLITNLSLISFFGDFGWAWENFRIRFDEWRGKRREEMVANNTEAIERAEKRRESRQEIPVEKEEKPKKLPKEETPTISLGDLVTQTPVIEEKKEIVTKKVSDIFSNLKEFAESKKAETPLIIQEVSEFSRETEDLMPTISNSDELVLEIEPPIDLIAESEKIPITPIQETGELEEDLLEIAEVEKEQIPLSKKPQTYENYALPTTEFLTPATARIEQKDEELLGIAQELTDKTKEFNVTGRVMHICQGPVVTTYEFKPDPGVKYSRVTGLADDLCLALKAESIRIDRIPGKAFVGIEVPNRERETIQLREVIESKKFQASDSLLSVALGKSIDGLNYVADLAKMPHLLIAGATGAGKSVGVNTLIVSILYKAKPDEVKLIMVDPKQVELNVYADIPHLATPIITDPKRASVALKWAVGQMERRYKDLAAWGVRNIDGYNGEVKRRNENGELNDEGEPHKKLPYLVIIIDELADLMMVAGKEVEESITRL
nr:DNA translocase FtsK [Pyrinomonadaceae bacterium]